MNCPICGADNSHAAKVCPSCGSNLRTRGGADIVMKDDGSVDHAGDSRWKSGAGMAGVGGVGAFLKFGGLGLFKLLWIFQLVRIASFGGAGILIAVLGGIGLITASFFRYRRRLHI